jgi:Beta-lactamase enzyme family
MGRLARAVYLAAAGAGPLPRLGVSASEARYLLWLLAQASDRGKLDRFLGPGPIVMHKSGWLPEAQHDSGIVAFRSGAYVATVLTWRTARADELTGRVSLAALRRFG